MVRRRDPGMVSFDVSSDALEEDDGGASVAPEPDPGWVTRLADRWRGATRSQRRRTAGIGGGAVLVLGGAVAVGGAVSAHAETERLRSAPGGVVSLDGDLVETWSLDDPGEVSAVLPDGGLLLVSGGAAVAIDTADGSERWRVELADETGAPVCGPTPRWGSPVEWSMPSEQVVCVHGGEDARTATVLDASGDVVGARDLDPAEYGDPRTVAPAAGGGLVVVEHDVDVPEPVDLGEDTGGGITFSEDPLEGALDEVPEAEIWVEDALTDDRRFDVPAGQSSDRSDPMFRCADVRPVDGRWYATVPPPGNPLSTPSLVSYAWCGVGGAASVGGVPLGSGWGAPQDDFWAGQVGSGPHPGGGYVVSDQTGESALLDADGEEVLRHPTNRVTVPRAVLGGDPSRAVVTGGGSLLLQGRDLEVLWSVAGLSDPVDVVARTDDAVVVAAGTAVRAYDAADGAELWRADLRDAVEGGDAIPFVTSAVSDGGRVAIALLGYASGGEDGRSVVVTLDLTTGEPVGDPVEPPGLVRLVAVDGDLLALTVEADYDEEAGVEALTVPTLRGLASQ